MSIKNIIYLAFFLVVTSCSTSTSDIGEDDIDELTFTFESTNNKIQKSKEIESFNCMLTQTFVNNSSSKSWKINLHFPKKVLEKAEDRKAKYKYTGRNKSETIERYAECLIPGTREAREMIDKLLRVKNGETTSGSKKKSCPENSEGYWCTEGSCWGDQAQTWCYDGTNYSLPGFEVIGEIEDPCYEYSCMTDNGGGGSGGSDLDPWSGGDPDPGDGGGSGLIDPESPCEGNPIKNPKIAAQLASGVNGGRDGLTRKNLDGSPKQHGGTDIATDVGQAIYSMYSGVVISRDTFDNLGNYVMIQVSVNGDIYTIEYGHLQDIGRIALNTQVDAGTLIGFQGVSGNLLDAVLKGRTTPHTHIIVKKKQADGSYERINPEDILTTKFDEEGNPISSTNC